MRCTDGVSQSGAIIEYLLDVYDKENKLRYTSFPEKYTQNSWKHFQMSGQGPYFGQKAWFSFVSTTRQALGLLAVPLMFDAVPPREEPHFGH